MSLNALITRLGAAKAELEQLMETLMAYSEDPTLMFPKKARKPRTKKVVVAEPAAAETTPTAAKPSSKSKKADHPVVMAVAEVFPGTGATESKSKSKSESKSKKAKAAEPVAVAAADDATDEALYAREYAGNWFLVSSRNEAWHQCEDGSRGKWAGFMTVNGIEEGEEPEFEEC